ncbi:flagellar basal body L-ring protein FlgH [Limobrevibacterium gyesilva]|uniref:Surface antigen n=1 Tax=Limobrevibacterium gyesilva TaxID=2991712 RepID=A0AA42CGK9_9PROT|nr:hypothetical protein [Limobrevibacterium gyesilva]MCW3477844.1 hypothetical protein [Limobrevibacterium gyesilva]
MRRFVLAAGLALICAGCVAPPPEPLISQATITTPPDNPACRDYTLQAIVHGEPQTIVGHACQQPDGTWRIVEAPQGQPAQSMMIYAPPPYAYYPYYDPWLWEPPIGLSVGAFVFVDRHHHFHDFRRFHERHGFASSGFHHGMENRFRNAGSGGRHG